MKKMIPIGLSALLLFTACGDNIEEKATQRLSAAQDALQRELFNEAKLQIDSIKILYPKAYQARKKGLDLMLQVELAEQEKSIIYLDSMLNIKQEELKQLLPHFIFEKDTAYQQIGNYFHPQQTVEKTLHRSFLRFQTNEQGTFTLTSVFAGKHPLHHQCIRVTAPDGTCATSPISNQCYESKILSEYIEKIDYKLGNENGVVDFIYQNIDKKLKIEFLGQHNHSFTMDNRDKQALKSIYPLARTLSAIYNIKENIKEANLKIRFLNKKIND